MEVQIGERAQASDERRDASCVVANVLSVCDQELGGSTGKLSSFSVTIMLVVSP